jgi:hypothetical protein
MKHFLRKCADGKPFTREQEIGFEQILGFPVPLDRRPL